MLFDETISRKPNLYPWTQEFIDAIWQGFWTPNEFNFKADYQQFHTELDPQRQQIVTRTVSAIGQIEIAVKTFWAKLGDNLPHPAMSDLGFALANSEVIHNQAYEKLLTVLDLEHMFEENLKVSVVANRVNYLRKYNKAVYPADYRKQYIYSVILFTLFVENVSLFSQFYIILWFKRFEHVLKDTAQQVSYTRLEEMLHSQVGIKLINTFRQEYPELFDEELKNRIINECKVSVEAEGRLIDWILGDFDQPKLNKNIVLTYLQNRMNESLVAIGYDGVFNTSDELLKQTMWMDEELLGNTMTDFFDSKPVSYSKNDKTYNEEDLF